MPIWVYGLINYDNATETFTGLNKQPEEIVPVERRIEKLDASDSRVENNERGHKTEGIATVH